MIESSPLTCESNSQILDSFSNPEHTRELAYRERCVQLENSGKLATPPLCMRERAKLDTTGKWKQRISVFKDRYRGERCFIIGNGPSLNKIDFGFLSKEYTFGVNGIFYMQDKLNFTPTFYTVEDNHVVADNLDRINEMDQSIRFFPEKYASVITSDPNTFFLPTDWMFYFGSSKHYAKPRFSKELSETIYVGQTVTYLNLQLAYYMGFQEVYFVGMDFSYHVPDSSKIEGLTIVSREDDPNHFHPDYFGKGKKWHDPKLEYCQRSYKHARKVYEDSGRTLRNATIGGALDCIERVNFFTIAKIPRVNHPCDLELYFLNEIIFNYNKKDQLLRLVTLDTKQQNLEDSQSKNIQSDIKIHLDYGSSIQHYSYESLEQLHDLKPTQNYPQPSEQHQHTSSLILIQALTCLNVKNPQSSPAMSRPSSTDLFIYGMDTEHGNSNKIFEILINFSDAHNDYVWVKDSIAIVSSHCEYAEIFGPLSPTNISKSTDICFLNPYFAICLLKKKRKYSKLFVVQNLKLEPNNLLSRDAIKLMNQLCQYQNPFVLFENQLIFFY